MRYFLKDFETSYNKTNPFGFFPLWQYYPKTGTHIGTDFIVPVGTSIIAPTEGEMFKTEVSGPKGNVGIFIFDHQGTTWGLELCHLKELPRLGKFKEGDVIAYTGNTGAATTGAHLHAVMHLGAKVTKNYQELQSRDAFLRLQKDGAIVDCWEWFRKNCVPTPAEYTGTDFYCDVALKGLVPLKKEHESTNVFAFHHTRPHWPTHIVVIPKKHISSFTTLTPADMPIFNEIMEVLRTLAAKVEKEKGAARILTNLGKYQDSKHLHFHISNGDPLTTS